MHLRIILAFLFGLSYSLTTAQSFIPEPEQAIKEACAKYTKELITDLQLNENEYIKLKSLNLQYITKVVERSTYPSFTYRSSDITIADMEIQYEQDLLSFLTPFQEQAYRKFKKNNSSVFLHLSGIALATGKTKELLANRIAP